MMDLRLEELPYVLDGRTYLLRCNMNVLADVQEAYDGDLTPALGSRGTLRSALEFLAAMLNDYADEQGWFLPDPETGRAELPRRFNARQLGRKIRRDELPTGDIFRLVTAAVYAPKAKTEDPEPDPQGDRGN